MILLFSGLTAFQICQLPVDAILSAFSPFFLTFQASSLRARVSFSKGTLSVSPFQIQETEVGAHWDVWSVVENPVGLRWKRWRGDVKGAFQNESICVIGVLSCGLWIYIPR